MLSILCIALDIESLFSYIVPKLRKSLDKARIFLQNSKCGWKVKSQGSHICASWWWMPSLDLSFCMHLGNSLYHYSSIKLVYLFCKVHVLRIFRSNGSFKLYQQHTFIDIARFIFSAPSINLRALLERGSEKKQHLWLRHRWLEW